MDGVKALVRFARALLPQLSLFADGSGTKVESNSSSIAQVRAGCDTALLNDGGQSGWTLAAGVPPCRNCYLLIAFSKENFHHSLSVLQPHGRQP